MLNLRENELEFYLFEIFVLLILIIGTQEKMFKGRDIDTIFMKIKSQSNHSLYSTYKAMIFYRQSVPNK